VKRNTSKKIKKMKNIRWYFYFYYRGTKRKYKDARRICRHDFH